MPDIHVGRFRGGLCVYWFENGKRRRYQLEARTREEAEPEAIEVYREKVFANRVHEATIADIWAAYIDDLGEKPTAKTMGYTGKAVLPHFGRFRPEDVDKRLCKRYVDLRLGQGKSVGTVWTELGHLQSALNFGCDSKMVSGRPPKIWRPSKPEKDKRILEVSEIRRFIDAAHEPHIRLALILLFGTAARVGAILDLTWDRVDLQRKVINLRLPDSVTRKGRAVVPMNNSVHAALLSAREAALTDYVIEYGGTNVKSIRKGVEGALVRANLGKLTIHEIRHTAAVHLVSAGIPIEKVAQYLGHSNTSVTYRVYGRFMPNHMSDAADVLDFMNLQKRG